MKMLQTGTILRFVRYLDMNSKQIASRIPACLCCYIYLDEIELCFKALVE
jgi:hypothetical protein